MSEPDLPAIEPVQDDAVSVVKVGLGIWLLAGVACVLLRDRLEARGDQWWILTCGAALLIGLFMLVLFTRRASHHRARAPLAGDAVSGRAAQVPGTTGGDSGGDRRAPGPG